MRSGDYSSLRQPEFEKPLSVHPGMPPQHITSESGLLEWYSEYCRELVAEQHKEAERRECCDGLERRL